MKTKLNPECLKPWLNKKSNRGFSITELLIVILMTGFMPAIFMPWFLNYYDSHPNQISLGNGRQ
jgi:competence protein ComGC